MKSLIVLLYTFLKRSFSKSKSLRYPKKRTKSLPLWRGVPLLTVKENGELRCNSCMLCVAACPVSCIEINGGKDSNMGLNKTPEKFELDLLRCVFCGYCEDSCPIDGIRMGPEKTLPLKNGAKTKMGIDFLAYRESLQGGVISVVEDYK